MRHYFFDNPYFNRKNNLTSLSFMLNEKRQLFIRFLKEHGMFQLVMKKYGSLTNLCYALPYDVRNYCTIFNGTIGDRLANEWAIFAKELIKSEEERVKQEYAANMEKLLKNSFFGSNWCDNSVVWNPTQSYNSNLYSYNCSNDMDFWSLYPWGNRR